MLKVLVDIGRGKKALEVSPKPTLDEPPDAIVRITKTLCGTDLHILKGDVASPGPNFGHEGNGIFEVAGSGISTFKPGDRTLIS